jgi:hypothetical protein
MLDFNRSPHLMNNDSKQIRVQVKLTNAIDEELVHRGLLNPDQIHTPWKLWLVQVIYAL